MTAGRPDSHPAPARAILALTLLALICTAVVALRVTPLDPGRSCCDMLFYRSMAFNLVRVTRPEFNTPPPEINFQSVYNDPYFGKYYKPENQFNRQPPYVYRPAAPLLARTVALVPQVGINRAFRTLAFLSLWAVACFTGLTVFDISSSLVAGGGAIITISALYRITAYHFWNYTMADPLAMALLALAIWLMFRRRDGWFLAVAALGLFTKETFALVLISFVLLLAIERRLGRQILLGVAGIVAVYILYRLTIPIPNDALTFSHAYVGLPGFSETVDIAFVVFGPLSLFAATRLWFSREALVLTPLVAGVYLLAMLTPDRERLFVYAFPALTIAVFAHPARNALALAALVAPAALTFAYTQRDAIPIELSVHAWRQLTYVAILIIEPLFMLSNSLWSRSPLVGVASRVTSSL